MLMSLVSSNRCVHSGEKSKQPCPCMSNPGAGVSFTVYLRFSVKSNHWSMSWTFTSAPGPHNSLSVLQGIGRVSLDSWSGDNRSCCGTGLGRSSQTPILLASCMTKASYGETSRAVCWFSCLVVT